MAELDFHLGSYVYVGNDPVNSVDMFGMYKKKIKEDTYEETVPFDEVTVTAKRNNVNAAFGFDLMYQAHARNKREFGEASPFRQNFQDGAKVAAGLALSTMSAVGLAEVGITAGASLLSKINIASIGRLAFRKEFLIKGGFNLFGQAFSNAVKNENKWDAVGLLLDMYAPNSVATVGGAFIGAGYDVEEGASYKETSKAGVGIGKMALGFGLGGFSGGVQKMIGPNGVSKMASTSADGVLKIYNEMGDAMIEKIGDSTDKQPKK